MKKKSKEKIIKITLVLVIIISIIVMINNYKKNQPLESIKVDERKISKETYAMYKENANGEYIPYESNEFPNNELYELNISKSYCVDRNENKINGIITVEGNKPKVSSDKTVYCYLYYDVINKEWEFAYTGNEQTFSVPYDGTYKVELWGASGGDIRAFTGGRGSYVAGKIVLSKNNSLYVYVGGEGTNTANGGYNGGQNLTNNGVYGSSGGGATDVRLLNGLWDDDDSLKSRIMVSGAGGGANDRNVNGDYMYGNGNGGSGGGLIGHDGQSINYKTSGSIQTYNAHSLGKGGTQTSGGVTECYYSDDTPRYVSLCWSEIGTFGNKGLQNSQSGSGSGYYGGGSGSHGAAGGGSSFISGHNGCIAIESATSLTPRLDNSGNRCANGTIDVECSKHYSGYVFIDTLMIDGEGYKWTTSKQGEEQMPKPDGTLYPLGQGHTGNGYAKITFIG